MSQELQKGGGVGLYKRNNYNTNTSPSVKYLPFCQIPPLLSNTSPSIKNIDNCAEIVTAEVKLRNSKRIIICCIFRAPNTDLTLLTVILKQYIYVVTLMLIYYSTINMLIQIIFYQLHSFGLHPLIIRPTRITCDTKTPIENIFTTDLCSHTQSGLIINDISDHLPIYVVTEYIHQETRHKTYIKKRLVNKERKRAFIKDLEKCNWDEIVTEEDVNITYNKFINLFTNLCS